MSGGDRKLLGRWGEAQVAEYLRKKKYNIIAAGWSCRFGEIDLIAQKGDLLAFVEVKLRKDSRFAKAREFVDVRKQNKLIQTARHYLMEHPAEYFLRFDVAEVYAPNGMGTINPEIVYFEGAFSPEE